MVAGKAFAYANPKDLTPCVEWFTTLSRRFYFSRQGPQSGGGHHYSPKNKTLAAAGVLSRAAKRKPKPQGGPAAYSVKIDPPMNSRSRELLGT